VHYLQEQIFSENSMQVSLNQNLVLQSNKVTTVRIQTID